MRFILLEQNISSVADVVGRPGGQTLFPSPCFVP